MRFPILSEQIRKLTEKDYRKLGLRGNPAYSELHRGEDVIARIPRESLESEVRGLIDLFAEGDKPKHIYLFSREGGAGKSHTQHLIREYCEQRDLPFIEIHHEDNEYDAIAGMRYLIKLADVQKVIFIAECDMPRGLYARLITIEEGYIIGSGHEPDKELRGAESEFRVLDLEREYAFSHEQIHQLLIQTLEKIQFKNTGPPLIPDDALRAMSENTQTPGTALNMLGACLAVAVYKAKVGKNPSLTTEETNYWLNWRVLESIM